MSCAKDGSLQSRRLNALSAIDRERYRAELIRAAGGNVESATRQDFARDPLSRPVVIEPGGDPWIDFERASARSHRLYCYRAIEAPDPHKLASRAAEYRCQVVYWYDLRDLGPIILPITPRPEKLVRIPADTPFLAAFWVIGSAQTH